MNPYNPQFYKAQILFRDQLMSKGMAGSACNDKRRGFTRKGVLAHQDFCGIKTGLDRKECNSMEQPGLQDLHT